MTPPAKSETPVDRALLLAPRPKLPKLGRGDVPWHQDSGYVAAHCDKQLIITCWIPLVDATPENGCVQILPRTHRGDQPCPAPDRTRT